MFRMWFKLWKDNHLIKDLTINNSEQTNRTRKVFHCLDEACNKLDLAVPIWLDKNIREFQKQSKTRFTKDSFMEDIAFDYMEIQVIEE